MLSATDVGEYLASRGVFATANGLEVEELAGGVSSAVFLAEGDGRRVVVKRALERFRVADEWLVPRDRLLAEADALKLMAAVAPASVPPVLDVDPETFTMVMAAAPASWRPWKSLLLLGEPDVAIATRLGQLLAVLHSADADIGSAESFDAQRIDPYFRTVQRRHPALADRVGSYVERLVATRKCLVHGDFSPKNVLVGDAGLWVIDWEVVHRGDAVFDLAFMLNHLLLKTTHRPGARTGYEACGHAFLSAYGPVQDLPYVLGLVGCLMLARVDGKSPAEYLTERERERARATGISMLAEPPASLAEAWVRVDEEG
ncbi:MAG TPA: aminoglycoside phosphotransferase family protein [Gaiellaceae bacterium]|nr:aminoglycoside phosphotransferase family protein [Gaiellaceae bacterium]